MADKHSLKEARCDNPRRYVFSHVTSGISSENDIIFYNKAVSKPSLVEKINTKPKFWEAFFFITAVLTPAIVVPLIAGLIVTAFFTKLSIVGGIGLFVYMVYKALTKNYYSKVRNDETIILVASKDGSFGKLFKYIKSLVVLVEKFGNLADAAEEEADIKSMSFRIRNEQYLFLAEIRDILDWAQLSGIDEEKLNDQTQKNVHELIAECKRRTDEIKDLIETETARQALYFEPAIEPTTTPEMIAVVKAKLEEARELTETTSSAKKEARDYGIQVLSEALDADHLRFTKEQMSQCMPSTATKGQ